MLDIDKEQLVKMLVSVKDYILTEDWDNVLAKIRLGQYKDKYSEFIAFLLEEYPEFTKHITTVPPYTFDGEVWDDKVVVALHLENVQDINSYGIQYAEGIEIYLSKAIRNISESGLINCNRCGIHFNGDIDEWKDIASGFGDYWYGDEQDGLVLVDNTGDEYLVGDNYSQIY